MIGATWSAEDQEWIGTCAEFPSLSWLAPNEIDALSGIHALVAEVIIDMAITGETPPSPGAHHWPT